MTILRLLADDLTGALDTAAELVRLVGPVPVLWHGASRPAPSSHVALDSGSREMTETSACQAVAALAPALAPALHGSGIAFKKVDSLLRGHTITELAACLQTLGGPPCVLAPAFPFQGRTTRGGQQFLRGNPVGPKLVDGLRQLGLAAQAGQPGHIPTGGVTVFDAETQDELDAVANQYRGAPILWCGTGGLAQALAQSGPSAPPGPLPRPILGLFGSDQAVTAAQLAACGQHWSALHDGGSRSVAGLAQRLQDRGVALASLALPDGLSRAEAAARIDAAYSALAPHLPRPGTLIVAGGETLRALCLALGADSLLLRGRVMPGVPVSVLRGGAWDGVTVVSKSGAFGHPTLLQELIRHPDEQELERTA